MHFLIFHRIYHHPSRRPTGFKQSNTQSVQTDKWEGKKKQNKLTRNWISSIRLQYIHFFPFCLRARLILAVVVKSFYIDRSFSSCLFSPWLLACCKMARARRWTTCPSKPWEEVLDCRALISPEIFRERQMVSLTPFIRETHIHHIRMMRCCCFKVSLFYRRSNRSRQIRSRRLFIFPIVWPKKKKKVQEKDFSESFFKRVVVVCRQL